MMCSMRPAGEKNAMWTKSKAEAIEREGSRVNEIQQIARLPRREMHGIATRAATPHTSRQNACEIVNIRTCTISRSPRRFSHEIRNFARPTQLSRTTKKMSSYWGEWERGSHHDLTPKCPNVVSVHTMISLCSPAAQTLLRPLVLL